MADASGASDVRPRAARRLVPAPGTDGSASLIDVFGGVRGMVDMTVPGLVFLVAYTASRSLTVSVWLSVAFAAVLAVLRVVRRETLQHAVGGFLGVAIAAFVAWKSGRAENFYLPGMLMSVGYACAYLISIAVRWPLLGVVLGPVFGENFTWRDNPGRRSAYTKASWVWVAMFLLRLVVMFPLYWAGQFTWLGVAKVALGVPPWLVAIYLTWLIMAKAPPPVKVGEEPPVRDRASEGEASARGGEHADTLVERSREGNAGAAPTPEVG